MKTLKKLFFPRACFLDAMQIKLFNTVGINFLIGEVVSFIVERDLSDFRHNLMDPSQSRYLHSKKVKQIIINLKAVLSKRYVFVAVFSIFSISAY
jgi:hypothetical protein